MSLFELHQGDALAFLRGLPDGHASLCVTSPPYSAQRTYGVGFTLKGLAWVDWLRPIVAEACRVTAGLVCVNVSAPVADHKYTPAVEWLVADLTRLDGLVCGPSPYAWVRNGTPGSGNKHSGYHRRCWEPVYCFARPDRLPLRWHDQLAFGKPPKCKAGGPASHRRTDGSRANRQGGPAAFDPPTNRRASGRRKGSGHNYFPRGGKGAAIAASRVAVNPMTACPPNVVVTKNGGGQCGHPLAHENEAPMNLALAERLVCWFCPPGGLLVDPFAGSGTSGHAALLHGRRFLGNDLRQSQVDLARRRLSSVTPGLFPASEDAA